MRVRTLKIVIFTRTGFHHTSFINRLQERFEIACVVREAYPEATEKKCLAFCIQEHLQEECSCPDQGRAIPEEIFQ